jgi:hypothetical protein
MQRFTKTKYFQFIDKTFAEMRELIEKKNNDYTAGALESDPFRNFREAEQFGIDPLAGLANRMNDKFNRIKAFCATGNLAVKTEGVEDAFHDMIGYSLLALGMLEELSEDPDQLQLPLDPVPAEDTLIPRDDEQRVALP